MANRVRCALVSVGVGALLVPLLATSGGASASPTVSHRVTLKSSTPQWASPAKAVGKLPATKRVHARVYLAARGGEAGLDAAVAAVSTPGSRQYGHYLTPAQYRARFAPSGSSVAAVAKWLSGAGMRVTGVASANRYVSVAGTSAQVQRAFGVELQTYRHDGRTQRAPAGDISIPGALAGQVLGVTGLSSAQVVRPASSPDFPPEPGFRNARPCSKYYGQKTARLKANHKARLPRFHGRFRPYAVCGYVPRQFRGAYGVTRSGLNGRGATVAITDAYASPNIRNDANRYATTHGDKAFGPGQFTQSPASGPYRLVKQCGGNGWYGEETLDVEAVHAIATQANVRYYASRSCANSDFIDALARAVDENKASYVSNSWSGPEGLETTGDVQAFEQVFKQGTMQGIGFLFSSGDDGDLALATGHKQSVYPASDPLVTAVGGTSAAIGAKARLLFQTGWGTNAYSLSKDGSHWVPIADNPFLYGGGGGFSHLFKRPAYQHGVVPTSSPAGRAVPDIALDGDPTTGMLVGETQTFPSGAHYGVYRIGGTSLSSPLMAGMQALASQKAGTRLGFANPRIYAIARSGGRGFTDVTAAHDGVANVRPDFGNGLNASQGIVYSVRTFDDDSSLATRKGWDDVTGVGTPNANYFAAVSH
jgi:subtilase family serine protease